jgi:hypothetical protein
MSVRTIIICDPAGAKDEMLEGVQRDCEVWGEIKLDVILCAYSMFPDARQTDADLLVIDYGGMSSCMGGEDRSRMEVRMACNWAEDHPGRPVVIWTSFTARLYRGELEAEFGHLGNILIRTSYPSTDEINAFFDVLRGWLGLKKETNE